MKKINKLALLLSFVVLAVAFGILSMTSMPEELRYSWQGINPWNGVEGVAFTVSYFLHTGNGTTYALTIGLVVLIWWRLYSLFNRIKHQ